MSIKLRSAKWTVFIITSLHVGNYRSKRIAFWQCEAPIVTLRLQLWPGSPERLTAAFQFRLKDMVVDLFIHCQVSLKELCDGLELKRPPLQPKIVSSFSSACTVFYDQFMNGI